MENPPEYIITDNGRGISCPRCAQQVGRLIQIGDMEWLATGGVAVRTLHGVCTACGHEFHWSVSDRMLAELVQAVLAERKRRAIVDP